MKFWTRYLKERDFRLAALAAEAVLVTLSAAGMSEAGETVGCEVLQNTQTVITIQVLDS